MEEIINKPKDGNLIIFEGIDGSGKSSQAERCFLRLKGFGLPVSLFKEPTNGIYGKVVRGLLSGKIARKSPKQELNLFIRDRKEDVSNNILPALERGEIVLLDRYYYSTIAYQGAMGLDIEQIRELNESFAPLPDLAFIFLIKPEEGIKRIIEGRSTGGDKYEKEEFLRKVDNIFRSLRDPQIRFIDSEGHFSRVCRDVDRIIDPFLIKKGWIY